jgi:hypothetical protein
MTSGNDFDFVMTTLIGNNSGADRKEPSHAGGIRKNLFDDE